MNWRSGRAAMATLMFAGLGFVAGGWPGESPSVGMVASETPCDEPVVLDAHDRSTLVCEGQVLALVLALCTPQRPILPGDRLQAEWSAGRCHSVAEPLTAGHRLRLGVPLDVNRASAAELTRIPGVGPVTARRIVEGRPWRSVQALRAVRGLGPRRLARIAPRLRATSPRLLSWPSRPRPGASSLRRP